MFTMPLDRPPIASSFHLGQALRLACPTCHATDSPFSPYCTFLIPTSEIVEHLQAANKRAMANRLSAIEWREVGAYYYGNKIGVMIYPLAFANREDEDNGADQDLLANVAISALSHIDSEMAKAMDLVDRFLARLPKQDFMAHTIEDGMGQVYYINAASPAINANVVDELLRISPEDGRVFLHTTCVYKRFGEFISFRTRNHGLVEPGPAMTALLQSELSDFRSMHHT